MRVLLVSAHGADRTYGGAERYVDELTEGLLKAGHDVFVLSAFPLRGASQAPTVSLHSTDWRDNLLRRVENHADDWLARPRPAVGAMLSELAPDLVHTNNLPGISSGVWAQGRRLGIPVVHTLHDYHLLCPRTTLTRADGSACRPSPVLCGLRTRRLARWSGAVDVVIGVSAYVLDRHGFFFPSLTERRVIRHPLSASPAADPPASPPRTLGYLGALTESKGVGLLLEAAEALTRRGIAVRIAGDGPMRSAVEASAAVRYDGHLGADALTRFMAGCDLGVIPSLWDEPGLTYALVEWLGAGRPVLVTGRGGLAEAAELPGVQLFKPSVEGLLGTFDAVRRPARWQELAQSIRGMRDGTERWLCEHLEAYAAAGARS